MQIDLTQEEITLISQLFTQSNLTLNRESMIGYVNMTTAILQKFQDVSTEIPKKEESSSDEEKSS